MKMKMKNTLSRIALSAGVLVFWGCGDLSLQSDRKPTTMELSPDTGLLTVGEPTKLEIVVKDQNGEVMPVPSWAAPTWQVSDKSVAEVSGDGMLTGTMGGRVTIEARLGTMDADARFRMNPAQVRLSAPVIYLNQGAQNRDGDVRLVAGRPALLRVFVVSDQVNWLEPPAVHVSLLRFDTVVFERVIPPETEHIPVNVDEASLLRSYDVEVPGPLIQDGVRLVVRLDPDGVVPLAPGSRTRYPEEGSLELSVDVVPLLRQIFVPTLSPHADESVYDWTDGLNPESPQVRVARSLLPVETMEVEVRETYWTDADLRTIEGWGQWLREIAVLYEQEGRRGYYYGVASMPTYGGLGYVGYPVSVGLDDAEVYAHELGHNQNLLHAPCGGASGPDPDYPYDNGSIGVWGWDIYDIFRDQLLNPATYEDFMGGCSPQWISDYHFSRAAAHRVNGDGGIDLDGGETPSGGPDRGEMLVVWGSVGNGSLALDPAFVVKGPQALPEAPGPYRVEGIGVEGRIEFSLSFRPRALKGGGGGFVFLVPYEPGWATTLDRIVLAGPEGEHVMARDGNTEMGVLTDPATGRIRAILRNWDGDAHPGEEGAVVTVTTGIPVGGLMP